MPDTTNTPQDQGQNQLTEAQAIVVVERGVKREIKRDVNRTLSYCDDAVKLQGFNVRKLAQKAEVRAEDKGEVFNANSYQSNVSNASGIMALFEYDLEAFQVWLENDAESQSLSKIFKLFRELFVAKPAKADDESEDSDESDNDAEGTPFEVIMSLLPHCTPDELSAIVDAAASLALADAA